MATYYIATTGSDSTGTGTSGNPWATISKAVTNSTTNDTINVAAGTYTWANQSFIGARNIVGVSPSTTILDAHSSQVLWTYSGLGHTISNLTLKNALNTVGETEIFVQFGNDVAYSLTVTNCIFTNITTGTNRAIFMDNSSHSAACSFIINSCLFYLNVPVASASASYFGGQNIGTTFSIASCTFYDTASSTRYKIVGANIVGTVNATFKNCIFYQSNSSTSFGTVVGTLSVTYSDLFNYTNPGGTGNITTDPLFIDPTNINFNLQPTSPCINTGTII